ncbi:flagellar motor switch phosphatase FliY [Halalkalibacterium halodurans]|uniref:flagellar motor switch phosphatase FliY n=1 Tax=Halalkalibacterium halodurans TaxID=86665 RepID=UPI0010672935|nr:flagellar motor switch phosphatase FliY [Halalkalibacterium halodurans]TES56900.1 flagellar motor switch phosphatase FliY [Halalkalibacterium halodurans]
MNDEMLSQDEINELLKGVASDGDDAEEVDGLDAPENQKGDSLEGFLTKVEKDALGEIGNISFGSAATALSTLLNEKVDITTPQVSVIHKDQLEKEFPQPHVAVHVDYTEGFEGMNLLVIRTKDAVIIADLMLGGDGLNPEEELNEMHISAVQEAMNQMMGSASTSMSTIFNKRIDISPPGVNMLDVGNDQGTDRVPEGDVLIKVSFRLRIGELIDSSIMQLVTVPFAKKMVDDLMNPAQDEVAGAVAMEVDQQPRQETVNEAPPTNQTDPVHMQQPTQGGYRQSMSQPPLQTRRQANVQPAAFTNFEHPKLNDTEAGNLDMLLDIPLQVTVELGRTKRSIKDILSFTQGSIIELDKLAGEPVDILVNQKLIAKGEVVVIDENFGVRVTEILSQRERIEQLK